MKFKDGLLLGVILGLGSALLYTPKPGEEVREEVREKLDSVPRHFFNLLESLIDLSISVLDFSKGAFEGQGERLSKAVSSGIDAAREKSEELRKMTSNTLSE
ncbi:MAG: YtxH domain-containing protein [Candidatus Melainabacteria bacterium]|nr:YtxH domain-containing protein [Candidatus Melainabacteria bacterium]MBI3307921.1 YtxH domain-containing protein [Candidatus Melainabacteria bacterium]